MRQCHDLSRLSDGERVVPPTASDLSRQRHKQPNPPLGPLKVAIARRDLKGLSAFEGFIDKQSCQRGRGASASTT
jgi:hypothetical protein